jgi:AmmeMemoRadiSam system protein A
MQSAEALERRLPDAARERLLDVAIGAIEAGFRMGRPTLPGLARDMEILHAVRASFVTLHRLGALRGCIGSLVARRTLAADVAYNAFGAAFRDPRFAPLRAAERDHLDIEISVLSPTEHVTFSDRADLIAKLRPGIDGVVATWAEYQATFLPAVWQSLPNADLFLDRLWSKAGIPATVPVRYVTVERYTVESFGRASA